MLFIFIIFLVNFVALIFQPFIMNWHKLTNGILLKNAPISGSLNETFNTDIQELGYSIYEIYTSFNLNHRPHPTILGYLKYLQRNLLLYIEMII